MQDKNSNSHIMKKIALLLLLITTGVMAFSQSQRLVLLEHFTQASCGPCAAVNPTIHTRLEANADKMTSINYHVSWPGYDPMYLHNTADPSARVSYYNVSAVPHSVIDGNVYSGSPNGWLNNMSIVNNRYTVPSPLTLKINQRISPTNDTIYVTMLIQVTANISGPMNAFMSVIEKHVHFNSAPGSNGEKDFYNVHKKMLPTKTGISLPTPLSAGDYLILEYYWVLANVYNINQLSVIGFVQNPITKEVLQSANLNPFPITAVYNRDVETSELINRADNFCFNSFSPRIKIRNNGNNLLNSLTLKYQVNNGDIQEYTWNGALPFLSKADIELPAIEFDLLDQNVIKIFVDQVNSNNDEYNKNDTIVHQFARSVTTVNELLLKIRTDNAPQETTWQVTDANGLVIATGGPYDLSNNTYNENITLLTNGCYTLTVFDAGGNGLCCSNGAGYYRLTPANSSQLIALGTEFKFQQNAQFEVVGVNTSQIKPESVKIYPNPASAKFNLNLPISASGYNIVVSNQLGSKVYEFNYSGGETTINSESWPKGIYLISIRSGEISLIQKINIVK